MTQVRGLSWVIKYRFDALVVFREMTFLLRRDHYEDSWVVSVYIAFLLILMYSVFD